MNATADQDALTDEQRMLAQSVRRFTERGYGAAQREASIRHPDGCLPETWRAFGSFGWLALPVPESQGGIGGSAADICLVAEALGRATVNEPFVACNVLAMGLLADAAHSDPASEWLPALVEGERRIAFAHGGDLAVGSSDNATLDGSPSLVVGGAGCDGFLVAPDVSPDGTAGLHLIAAGSRGLTVMPCSLYDGQGAARLRFEGCGAGVTIWQGSLAARDALVARAFERATVAHCAETVGTMREAYETTLDYLKIRKQFGRSIASNQVVQHRLVDLLVEIEEARAMTFSAAAALDAAREGFESARFAAAAKACTTHAARAVWREAVQLHGAIGMTQEYAVGQCIKRLAAAATRFGSETLHLETLARLRFDTQATAGEAA